jgi:hypothetical protein
MSQEQNHEATRSLCFRLFDRAGLWLSNAPKTELVALFDAARTWPQKVEHKGSEYLVIEKNVLMNWECPMDAAEMAKHFSKSHLERLEIGEQPEDRLESETFPGRTK